MRSVTAILLFCSVVQCLAQNRSVEGRIIDSKTNLPIEGAYIFLPGKNVGTASNRNGEFQFTISEGSKATLVISAIPYKSEKVEITPEAKILNIILERQTPSQRKTPLTAQQLVHDCIGRISRNYPSNKNSLELFQREYVTSFGNIIQYLHLFSQTGSTSDHTGPTVDDGLYMEDKRQRGMYWNSSSGGFYTFGWSKLGEVESPSAQCFLGAHLKHPADIDKYYSFNLRGSIPGDGNPLYIIDFDQKNIKGSFLKGTLYIDSLTKALVKIRYSLSPKGYKYALPNRTTSGNQICKPPLNVEIVRNDGEVNFRRQTEGWVYQNSFSNIQFNVSVDSLSQHKDKHYLKMHTEASVTNFSKIKDANDTSSHALIAYEFLKNNFEKYTLSDFRNNEIKSDTNLFEVAKALAKNNHLSERNAGRKAEDKLMGATRLSKDELSADLDFLQEMLFKIHPDLFRHTSDHQIKSRIEGVRKRLNRDLTEQEFYKLILPVIARLHCEHTVLKPSNATEEHHHKFAKYFPFDIRVQGQRMLIEHHANDTVVLKEVMKINGTNVVSLINSLQDRVTAEGTDSQRIDDALSAQFASLYALYYDQPDSFRIELMDASTSRPEVRTYAARPLKTVSSSDRLSYHEIDSLKAAILTIPSFSNEQKLVSELQRWFQSLHNNQVTNLVIDLRNNASGNYNVGSMVHSLLTGDSSDYYTKFEIATGDTALWNKIFVGQQRLSKAIPTFLASIITTDTTIMYKPTVKTLKHVGAPIFFGNVYVLVNKGTQATASQLAMSLQSSQRGVIVGDEISLSRCAYLSDDKSYVTLPHSKIKLYLPIAKHSGGVNSTLIPNYTLESSSETLTEGKDQALSIVLKLIGENCCSAKSD